MGLDGSQINKEGEPFDLRRYSAYRLSMLVANMGRAFTEALDAEGLDISTMEWRVLGVIRQFSPMTTQQVIAHSSFDPVKISRTLAKLQAKGLIERRAVPDDRRAHFISVTPEGDALARRLGELSTHLETAWLAKLTAKEKAALFSILDKLEAPI